MRPGPRGVGRSRRVVDDAFIVYPGRDKICSSMRWEDVRNGLEDFEYLYMLHQLATDRHAKIGKIDRFALIAARFNNSRESGV